MNILVTRPAAQAGRTAARLRRAGHRALVAPLMSVTALPWQAPPGLFQAVVATSANAFAAPVPASLRALPLYAVGAATAAAARAAGFVEVIEGPGGGAAPLYRLMAAAGITAALHLAGARVKDAPVPPPLSIVRRTVYRAGPCPLSAEAAAALRRGEIDRVLLYSAAAARTFAAECARLGLARGRLSLALLGAVPAGFPVGWQHLYRAAKPTEDALFAAAGLLCE